MHLIRLVIASERVHHEIDAGAARHPPLHLAAWHSGVKRSVVLIERPGTGKIIRGDDDRAHTIGAARALGAVSLAFGLGLDPERATFPAAGKITHQIEGFGE